MTNIIAEIGLNHNGSFKKAKKYIVECAKVGVWGVKFQIHNAKYESTLEEKFRVKISSKYKSRYDYWKKTSFTYAEWKKLFNLCKRKKIKFVISPFSIHTASQMEEIGVEYWKIGSGELYNDQLIEFLSKKKRKIIMSSGMSNWLELKNVYKKLNKNFKNEIIILQCTSMYPCNLDEVGLNVIREIKKKFKCKSGLSDHSGKIYPSLSVIANQDDFLEVHVKLNDKSKFPDKSSSLNLEDLDLLQKYNNSMKLLNKKINKDRVYRKFNKMRELFSRSLTLKKDLKKGTILKKEDLILKKPGTGLGYKNLNFFIGKKLKQKIFHNELLKKKYVI
jgi:N-acetylneuraminate synthase